MRHERLGDAGASCQRPVRTPGPDGLARQGPGSDARARLGRRARGPAGLAPRLPRLRPASCQPSTWCTLGGFSTRIPTRRPGATTTVERERLSLKALRGDTRDLTCTAWTYGRMSGSDGPKSSRLTEGVPARITLAEGTPAARGRTGHAHGAGRGNALRNRERRRPRHRRSLSPSPGSWRTSGSCRVVC